MKSIESTGKTIEEAVQQGLNELGKSREQVEVKIIDIPSKGFLGLIGTKLAKVRLTVVDRPEDDVKIFLEDLFKGMDLEVQMQIEAKGDTLNIYLEGPNMGVVIGRRGQTLDAVQYLASLVVNKNREDYLKVFIDTEDYRRKREETLVKLANKMARKVKKIGRTITLEPMNPYERRIIHSTLQGNPFVQTYSEGEEPYRKVAITVRK
ncbi:RNA-binding cell elongation regulator Jag/EloR [Clostridium formicaceticum]|uniref:RNA-binding protein KhpB n=1 Tax=Clostridium formicaceticum TaxID=1497 RepID=A0AAC9RS38_9CLOT|nr:RNA-binding cell elongation regulator Jag/EloR [Clostridium formicaceticum]AOY75411.1 protein jag [Clostridium formicaceticum]ARE89868.1 R3H domain protein [Clostridium formicaceticum]